MIQFVHVNPRIEKKLEILRKSGKKGAIAAREAEKIIQQLYRQRRFPECLHKASRNGEMRMRRCVKYDLGHGYRMVTLRRNEILHVAFVGTHDESDRWIAHNKRLPTDLPRTRSGLMAVESGPSESMDHSGQNHPVDIEEDPVSPIDDSTLRIVFSGLIRKSYMEKPHESPFSSWADEIEWNPSEKNH